MPTEQTFANTGTVPGGASPGLAVLPGVMNALSAGAQFAGANPLATAMTVVGAANVGTTMFQKYQEKQANRRRQARLDNEIQRNRNIMQNNGGLSRSQRRSLNASSNAAARSNARTLKTQEVNMMNALGSEAGVGNAAVISANAGQARVNANLDMQAQNAAKAADMVSAREKLIRDLFAEKRNSDYASTQAQIGLTSGLKPSGANIYPAAAELQSTAKPPAPTTSWQRKSSGRSSRV